MKVAFKFIDSVTGQPRHLAQQSVPPLLHSISRPEEKKKKLCY
jgi:hypothetical protein